MKSPTGRNSCDFEGCHFQQHFGTRSKKLRALGCRLEHVIFFASGTSMLKMATLKIARITTGEGTSISCLHNFS